MSDPELHPLLLRQLRRAGLEPGPFTQGSAAVAGLLQRVSHAYEEYDQERDLLDRSQRLASQEMADLYAALRAERDLLETRVQERTRALQVSEARLASLLSLSADWIWEQDADLRFSFISEGLRATAGFEPSVLLGRQRFDGQNFDASPEAMAQYEACVEARQPFSHFNYAFTRPDGVRRYIQISGEPVFDDEGRFQGYRGVGTDITDATLAEQRVQELARFDSLTGLPNRNMFLTELERAMARSQRTSAPFAVAFIDLDRFKNVNDTLGHGAGDELLCEMARRLRQSVRGNDLVARLGGDEFVVLLEGSDAAADLHVAAQKLLGALSEPMTIQQQRFLVTGSIGLARFPADGSDAATLLKNADAAMYLAKERGKNNVQFYTAELAALAAQQFELESALRLALPRDELQLHYQPKVSLQTRELVGMEALLRWRHPSRGLVPPGDFIPLAEERGLIVVIGRWVIQAACRQMAQWRAMGLQPPPVAVNLSAAQCGSETLVSDLRDAMAQHGLLPGDLHVELTESVLMADPERASQTLQQLHDMGVSIAIDDFGTGYSSLSYLKRFPAQTVKIDRSFVRGLPADADDMAITGAVVAMAHSLGLDVVAEGVETEAQLQALLALGCDAAQGYLLGHPVPAAELAGRLRRL